MTTKKVSEDDRVTALEKEVAAIKELMRRNGWSLPKEK